MLGWIAFALQTIGLLLAALGLVQTWAEFGRGERFLPALPRPIVLVLSRVAAAVRRVLRRPRAVVAHAGLAGAVGASGSVRARVLYGRLPKHDATAALAILEIRVKDLRKSIDDYRDKVDDELLELRALLVSLERDLRSEARRLEARDQRVATGGIRLEALGIALATLGTVLQPFA